VTGRQKTNPPKYYSMKASVKEISPLLRQLYDEEGVIAAWLLVQWWRPGPLLD
jgi:hypothetical protein